MTTCRLLYADQQYRLLVSGRVSLSAPGGSPVEVTRGMSILSRDGREVGRVAAVVVDRRSRVATHILLCRWPQTPEYRLAALGHVAEVSEAAVRLQIHGQAVAGLPIHRPSK